MSRALWFAAGAASGAYALVKARRTVWHLTPDGIGARVAAVGVGARLFTAQVSAGMAEREAELQAKLRLSSTTPQAALEESAASDDEAGSLADGHR